jgi:transposase
MDRLQPTQVLPVLRPPRYPLVQILRDGGLFVCLRPGVWHSGPRRSRTSADALASLRAVFDPLTDCGRCALPRAQGQRARNQIHQESAMRYPCGHTRKLSDRQIRVVLTWHREAHKFRHRHGTARDLAALLGVSSAAIRGLVEPSASSNRRGIKCIPSPNRRGRPRHLNSAQIAFVIAWRNAGQRFRLRHGNVAGLALKMGVSVSTIHDCIRRRGRYTQFTRVALSVRRMSGRTRSLRSDEALRSKLLRMWRRTSSPS